jgi:hypothetical protein
MTYVGKNEYKLGRMKMSHMVSDTLGELHAMADRIGVKRKYFQDKPGRPHYDICMSTKNMAIGFGAIEVSDREFFKLGIFKELPKDTKK